MSCILMLAGGTGGHVMPALAVADKLRKTGVEIVWMGTNSGIESRLVPESGYLLETVRIKGLHGYGIVRKLVLPFMLLNALIQAYIVFQRRKPVGVIGMGGFVAGPGGLLAVITRIPLVIHEQNALFGTTNRWLARWAGAVLSGFPNPRGIHSQSTWVGNPVRDSITQLDEPQKRLADPRRKQKLRVLIVGGSQGAQVFNQELPNFLGVACAAGAPLKVWHQCGKNNKDDLSKHYQQHNVDSRISEFIDDMAAAYNWCDLVICRAGAMTVSEICAAGCVALFIPYPYAVNDHQTANAEYMASKNAALIVHQDTFVNGEWVDQLISLHHDRDRLMQMAVAARGLAKPRAAEEVAEICQQVIHA